MDFQRVIAFIVFSLSILLLWEAWQDYNRPAPPTAPNGATASNADADAATSLPTPGRTLKAEHAPEGSETTQGARAVIKTDVMEVVIDANGGDLRELILPRYRKNDDKTQPFKLFEERPGRNYFAQSGFIGGGLPTHKTLYQLEPGEYVLQPGEDRLTLTLTAVSGEVEVSKTYTFRRASYVIDVDYRIVNRSHTEIESFPYYQLLRHGQAPEGESAFMYTFTGPAQYTEAGKFQKIHFDDIAKGKQDHIRTANDGWIGMVQHHFVAAWMTRDPTSNVPREFYTRALGNGEYTAGLILPAVRIAPGATEEVSMRLYAGPQDQETLKALAPGLQHVVDYGIFTVIAYPLFILLNWLKNLVGNWGWAIVLLTVLIKLAFYPLSAASYKSMAQMRKLAPRLQHLKERYGDDRQKLHEQMMKIYKEEKINPLGGCLPILVQIPVFIALYWVLLSAVELREAPWALWITDLSEPDPYYVLPVIMAVTMYIQQKLSPMPPDPIQAKILMIMPIVFSIFFFFFPSGLVLYWLVNNILSILQQWRINVVIERAGYGSKPKAK